MGRNAWCRWTYLLALTVLVVGGPVFTARADSPADRLRAAEADRVALIQRVSPAVISVFRVDKSGNELAQGSGSGVIISADGYALTNFHVTGPAEELRVGLPGGRIYKAERRGIDPTGDIAVLKIESDQQLPFAALGDSSALRVGQWVVAVGNPFLLATDFRPTVSFGVISGLHRFLPGAGAQLIYADAIQIDAALNPGNSGGPLFNDRGELVGINGRITIRQVEGMQMNKINMGVGFAIPLHAIRPFLDPLKAGHNVDRGYLGLGRTEVKDESLEILSVIADSPADLYGLRAGDQLLSVDGRPVNDPAELQNIILLKPAGARIAVQYRRGEQTQNITIQLAGVQTASWLFAALRQGGAGERLSLFRPDAAKSADDSSKEKAAQGDTPKDQAPKDEAPKSREPKSDAPKDGPSGDAAPKNTPAPDASKPGDAPQKGDE
jgi:S1-C subfamily serine protease